MKLRRLSRDQDQRQSPSVSLSLGRSFSAAGRAVRRQTWLWPLLGTAVLGLVGWLLYGTVEKSLKANLGDELQAILRADLAALDLWLQTQQDKADQTARDERLVDATRQLHELRGADAELLRAPSQQALRKLLAPMIANKKYSGYILVSTSGRVLSTWRDELVGKPAKQLYDDLEFLQKTLAGKPTVSRPMPSAALLPDRRGKLRAGVPTMFACAPVRDASGKTLAAMCLRIVPEAEFTAILNVAHFGESGETYAFNRRGLLLSSSRFDDSLKQIGLLPDNEDAQSILTLRLLDPGVDLTLGERSPVGAAKPLTRMATEATAGHDGIDVDGYRDYRGVPVVGAWRWLSDYNMGIATEVDSAEAFHALGILRTAFWILFGLLILASVGMLVAITILSRVKLALMKATIESKQLGQYVLEDKLGEGGMGVVYRARHAFLRRPTAVKLLHPSLGNELAVQRFEREVQLTSQLSHPNTIAIYDYGRTDDGVFYYAMEYLDGISLDQLIGQCGPLPDGRALHILQQVCGSLVEAHEHGLIHRDIKPANIMVNRRAGMFDVVKVLDFGLVKSVGSGRDATATAAHTIVGTPHYMPPEAIVAPDEMDARSDLYAIGAVGYFLLTGKPVFDGAAVMEICQQHLNVAPQPLSQRTTQPMSPELEAAILRCLQKRKEDRPESASALLEMFVQSRPARPWTRLDARQWWETNAGGLDVRRAASDAETNRHAQTALFQEGVR